MSFVAINVGTQPDDGTGSTLRAGGEIINSNFLTAQTQLDVVFNGGNAGNILYVSKGATATDTRTNLSPYDAYSPFAGLEAARDAASEGDFISVSPGDFTVTSSLAKDGVNWYFAPGSSVIGIGAIWAGGSYVVWGCGDFSSTLPDLGAPGSALIAFTSGIAEIHGRSLTASNNGASTHGDIIYRAGSGKLSVYFDNLTPTGGDVDPMRWENGETYLNGRLINGYIVSYVVDAPTGNLHVRAAKQTSPLQDGSPAGPTIYLDIQEAFGVYVLDASTATIYLSAESFSLCEYEEGTGSLFISAKEGRAGIIMSAGNVEMDVKNWKFTSDTTALLTQTGGSLTLRDGNFTGRAGDNGINLSGGTLRLSGFRCDTSANSSGNPVTKSGGVLILDDVTMVANGTQKCIEVPSAQTVVVYSARANTAVSTAFTITQTVGTVTVNAAVV